jgi:hypothetical protein
MEKRICAHIYGLFPIDYGWDYLPLLSDIEVREGKNGGLNDLNLSGAREMLMRATPCLINDMGWEGDFAVPLRAILLPSGDTDMEIALVWKQSNNGNSYVVSPKPLVWLEDHAFEYEAISYYEDREPLSMV